MIINALDSRFSTPNFVFGTTPVIRIRQVINNIILFYTYANNKNINNIRRAQRRGGCP